MKANVAVRFKRKSTLSYEVFHLYEMNRWCAFSGSFSKPENLTSSPPVPSRSTTKSVSGFGKRRMYFWYVGQATSVMRVAQPRTIPAGVRTKNVCASGSDSFIMTIAMIECSKSVSRVGKRLTRSPRMMRSQCTISARACIRPQGTKTVQNVSEGNSVVLRQRAT